MPEVENHQIVLASRPCGLPDASHLQLRATPAPEPREGQFQIRHSYIGLSPSTRIRMGGDSAYGAGIALGEMVPGQTVGVVSRSRHPQFREGDTVVTNGGWQEYSLSSGKSALLIDPAEVSPQDALGVLGTSGLTAYVGLTTFGLPASGETLVVSAASGSVGSIVGQIGLRLGCRVVGITGGPEKCTYLTQTLGFHAAVDHRAGDFPTALATACPHGVDIYFENVGGAVRDAAWSLMADFGRVVLCGMIAEYNDMTSSNGPSWFPILSKRLVVSGFLLRDHLDRAQEYQARAKEWISQGQLRMRYDISEGLATAPAAFARMLAGSNFGKSLVKLAHD